MQNSHGKVQQWIAALVVSLLSISSGIGCAWPSPVIPKLRSNDPPIGNVTMSQDQVSWIAALYPVGSLLIVPFCGLLCERVGRRNFALLTGLPYITSGLLSIFAPHYVYLYAARVLVGMATGMTVFIAPLYSSEIASEDIRGVLGSLLSLFSNIGVLLTFVSGAFLPYGLFCSLSIVFAVVFVFAIPFLPDTPVYLVRKNRHIEARKSLMFFRDRNLQVVDRELARLQQQVKDSERAKKIRLSYFFSDRATRRGLIISIGLLAGQQLSGIFAMISYAETIFKYAGTSVSSETAPIIIGVMQVTGEFTSATLIDGKGRRPLTLFSCFGMAVSHATVAGFFYFERRHYDVSSFAWLPVIFLSTYVVTYVLGMSGVPYVVVSEVFRSDVSSFATTICFTLYWAMTLASIKIFDLAMRELGADGCFFMLACFCLASLAFVYLMLPETKGREREDIVDELAAVGKSWRARSQETRADATREQFC